MDPFGKIPSPVLIIIAKSAPDLASLHSLRLASPVCAELLTDAELGAEIVEVVATASLARVNRSILAHIWQFLQTPQSTSSHTLELAKQDEDATSSPPSAESTLRLLALAGVVHNAAHRCLHTLLQRLIASRPRRLLDTRFDLRRQRFWKWDGGRPFEPPPQPPSEAVDIDLVKAAAPFTWVEEQRALHGAWQLAWLSIAGGNATDVNAYGEQGVHEELLDTILDRGKGGTAWAASQGQPCRLSRVFPSAAPPCREACCSVDARPDDSAWEARPSGLGALDPAWSLFTYAHMANWSPLREASFDPFQALGFRLWGKSRFVAMGLLSDDRFIKSLGPRGPRLAEYGDMYAWKSLLTPTQLEALESAQRATWPPR